MHYMCVIYSKVVGLVPGNGLTMALGSSHHHLLCFLD